MSEMEAAQAELAEAKERYAIAKAKAERANSAPRPNL